MVPSADELTGLELLKRAINLPPSIGSLLGMTFDEVGHGRVVMSLHTRPEFANPLGTLHGGICATLLDSAMSSAVHSTLEAGVGYGTLELKVNYVRSVPVDGVKLTATAHTIHVGRTTATAEGRVYDPDGRLVAHGSTTCIIHR
ncbi:PaaI family thioesterase [Mycobacterium sp.]|uniref:PaaI family thioesterase n=1 Tax=Mycobacterium sp. TaxID=1785 RepID=UPI0039C95894